MKAAMRAKDAARLSTIRLLLAAIKQREVDERIELDDANVVAVIQKMLKQRQESITQFEKASRNDLADVEKAEVQVLSAYLPASTDCAKRSPAGNKRSSCSCVRPKHLRAVQPPSSQSKPKATILRSSPFPASCPDRSASSGSRPEPC